MEVPLSFLINVLNAGGPYVVTAIFILVWWSERQDRRAKEDQLARVYQEMLALVEETTRVNEGVQQALVALKEAVHALHGRLR
jgi:hypothetical protein